MRVSYQTVLQGELSRRCEKNSHYSLRAFAKFLEISPSSLSEILSGKRGISKNRATRIAEKLSLCPEQSAAFIHSVPVRGTKNYFSAARYVELAPEDFELISHPYVWALLSLLQLESYQEDIPKMAKAIGVDYEKIEKALENLLLLGLVKKIDQRFVRTGKSLRSSEEIPSQSIRNFHKEVFQLASESLEKDPVDQRDIRSMTMAIDEENLPKAKKLMLNFMAEMSKLMSTENPQKVYELSLAFFPLTSALES